MCDRPTWQRWDRHGGLSDPKLGPFLTDVQRRVTDAAVLAYQTGAPPLYTSGVRYQRDPVGCNHPAAWWECIGRGSADCEDLAAWRAAERRQTEGRWPELVITDTDTPGLVHVRLADEDPSAELAARGLYLPGRRSPDGFCPGPGAPVYEAGQVPAHRDPAQLDPALRAGLQRCQDAGIGVSLVSGYRPPERQISLWRDRIDLARSTGGPPSWEAVEADLPRWAAWVRAESRGQHGRPMLALPGLSQHQRGRAMDLGGSRAELDRCAELSGLRRPVPGEPWHYEP